MTRRRADFSAGRDLRIVALAGGVGGAKLVQGLAYHLPPSQLRIIVNTGDDFEHLGLTICPDLDTVMYTLAGIANPKTGWGVEGETFHCLESVRRLGGASWFRLGDRDLATHLLRSHKLQEGLRLTEVTQRLAQSLGVQHPLLPMADAPFRTRVLTDGGELAFQDYFVRQACRPRVVGFRWEASEGTGPTQEVMAALAWADVVVICPSNPFVSIDPILALPGVRDAVAARPVLAVSPIIGGEAVKGPAAKMFRELIGEPSALAVADYYRGLPAGFFVDRLDAEEVGDIEKLGIAVRVAQTLMPALEQRVELAREVLELAAELGS
jgi:LPPG:FO 2-phospho-L-lactate transferase